MKYFVKWFLPGCFFIALAFWAGTQSNIIFALAGFLSFFVVGIALITKGKQRAKG